MAITPKPHNCKECGTKNPEDFWGHAKSLCSKCRIKKNNNPEFKKKKAEYRRKYNLKKKQEKEEKEKEKYPRFNIVFTEYPVVLRWD